MLYTKSCTFMYTSKEGLNMHTMHLWLQRYSEQEKENYSEVGRRVSMRERRRKKSQPSYIYKHKLKYGYILLMKKKAKNTVRQCEAVHKQNQSLTTITTLSSIAALKPLSQ